MADDSDARPSSSDFDHEELDRNLEMGYSSGSGSEYLPDSAPPSRPRTPAAFGHTAVPEEEGDDSSSSWESSSEEEEEKKEPEELDWLEFEAEGGDGESVQSPFDG